MCMSWSKALSYLIIVVRTLFLAVLLSLHVDPSISQFVHHSSKLMRISRPHLGSWNQILCHVSCVPFEGVAVSLILDQSFKTWLKHQLIFVHCARPDAFECDELL